MRLSIEDCRMGAGVTLQAIWTRRTFSAQPAAATAAMTLDTLHSCRTAISRYRDTIHTANFSVNPVGLPCKLNIILRS